MNWFLDMGDAKQKIESWRHKYNEERPHYSLRYLTPMEFIEKQQFRLKSLLLADPVNDVYAISRKTLVLNCPIKGTYANTRSLSKKLH